MFAYPEGLGINPCYVFESLRTLETAKLSALGGLTKSLSALNTPAIKTTTPLCRPPFASGPRPDSGTGAGACRESAGFYNQHMTEAIAFDPHRFVKRLTESGCTEKQAETLAEEHVALLNTNLATKADVARIETDIESLKVATNADTEAPRLETKASIESLKADLPKWLFGALIAQGGLIVALVKLL